MDCPQWIRGTGTFIHKIFREVVANCIVHREYTSGYATELLITASEVRITNPNRPLFHGFINWQNFAPYPKNPNLRKFFTAFGWTEEIGSGVRNTSPCGAPRCIF